MNLYLHFNIIISVKTTIFLVGEISQMSLKMVVIVCEIISVHFTNKNCAAQYLYFYVIYFYYSVRSLFSFLFIKQLN